MSAALARNGVPPMFGFPTRVRKPVGHADQDSWLRDRVVADRALDMAIVSFAPEAEVVKDGLLHQVEGFAAYKVKGKVVEAVDPSGTPRALARCPSCG